MKVEIWSDVVCPFCYVGKRKFEKALGEFAHQGDVQIEWKSFQLTPDFVPTPGENIHASLAKKKGVPEAEGRRMNDYMTQVAKEVGLDYQFDKAIPANTFLAHQLIHFGAHQGRQDAMKERLFAAYYLEGQDLNSLDTLANLAAEIGLDATAARQALEAGTYANEVRRDEYEAQQIGVRGVPFFVFDDKYAVSGAQPSEVFAEVLDKVWEESHPTKAQPTMLADGPACGPDGCD
ncbi:protein disulfide isomerase FrnE [Hymenobacter ginsengisoli]|uniref:Protein disulfide isomerase FrnE n=1 Tax=Hymenobacter ginsengisoli TaxID=1051626 RepID=A0ABP8QHJ8_9BACT|nr:MULTISPECIES: DsbA family oxidoreductase [unclassified Hymenobacter]MBO2031970.1 DsbA family oxidoreductase [Hymenobacter sp. BT559]